MEAAFVLGIISMIPIVALAASAYRNVKHREYTHRERMLALEKGMPAVIDALVEPGEAPESRRSRNGTAVHGVVWSCIGAGVLAGTFVVGAGAVGDDLGKFMTVLQLWAFPALFVGLGLLIYGYLTRNGRAGKGIMIARFAARFMSPRALGLMVAAAVAVLASLLAPPAASPAGPGATLVPPPLLFEGVALNATHVVFASSGDLWIVGREGGEASRLTSGPADDARPVMSPDGRRVAFSRVNGRGRDVYLVDVAGGEPRRLTWHPKTDSPRAWTPDGAEVVFSSDREGDMLYRLYRVAADGVWPEALPLPTGAEISFAPDGLRAAYQPNGTMTGWGHYRGGMAAEIRIVTLADGALQRLPTAKETGARANDFRPMWIGDTIYFLSDRDGTPNLWTFEPRSRKLRRVTAYAKYGVDDAAAARDALVLLHDGALELLDLATRTVRPVPVTVAVDTSAFTSRTVPVGDAVEGFNLSPDGSSAVFGARGDVLTLDLAGGTARNLTASPGSTERTPAWSPDGARIAWFSDRSGENLLEIAEAPGGRVLHAIRIGDHASYYGEPSWSPAGTHLAVGDCHGRLWLVDVVAGRARGIDESGFPGESYSDLAWSADGGRFAWSRRLDTRVQAIFLHDIATGRTRPLTDGTRNARLPAFDRAGGMLYFAVSTFAPAADQFGMSSILYRSLAASELQSLALETEGARPVTLRADTRHHAALFPGEPGALWLFVSDPPPGLSRSRGRTSLVHLDLATGRAETRLEDAGGGVVLSADRRVFLMAARGGFARGNLDSAGVAPAPVTLDSLVAPGDARLEWAAIYRDAWRMMREYFYDPGFHGQDLDALEQHYAAWLPGITRRTDLNRLMTRMFTHMSVSHLDVEGGDMSAEEVPAADLPAGLPGADFALVDGRYRITRIYHGDNSQPLTTAPLDQPGVEVREGDYLLAVDGTPVDGSRELYAFFAGKGRAPVELTTGPDPGGKGARTSRVALLQGENTLRRMAWAEENRRRVDQLSAGRLGYIYLPDTGLRGLDLFGRQFLASSGRSGLVVDERWNSGGAPADWFIEMLARRPLSGYAFRDGDDIPFPSVHVPGPRVMITNEASGSGGDTLPWMFRRAGLGPIVGRRTMGAGIGGYSQVPAFLDGGRISIPSRGFYNPDGSWDIENGGVAPDLEVEILPADWLAGRDPQLARAVDLAMKALARAPPPRAIRPAGAVHP